jgi:hypothetical protein
MRTEGGRKDGVLLHLQSRVVALTRVVDVAIK